MGDVKKKTQASRQRITHILLLCAIVAVGVMGYVDQLAMNAIEEVAESQSEKTHDVGVALVRAPDVLFDAMDGEKIALEKFRGKTIVLHFWATWCVPCVKEFPELLKMASLAKDDVVLMAVSNDRNKVDVVKFLQRVDKENLSQGKNVVLVMDASRKMSQDVFQSYKLPETIIVSTSFQMVKKIVGAETKWSDATMLDYLKGL